MLNEQTCSIKDLFQSIEKTFPLLRQSAQSRARAGKINSSQLANHSRGFGSSAHLE